MKHTLDFEQEVGPYLDRFIKIKLTKKDIEKVQNFVDSVESAKMQEHHYRFDKGSFKKRHMTGKVGELAISKLLKEDFVDWDIGHSSQFNVADLKPLGINVGIKTVEYGKFPIVHKNPKRPEIIVLKGADYAYICGVATVDIMKEHSSDDLILSPRLRARGVKTGFHGFKDLIFFEGKNYLEVLRGINEKK